MMRLFLAGVIAAGSVAGQSLSFTPLSLSAGSTPKSIHLAKLSGSPYPDVLVVNAGGINQNSVTVLMGGPGLTYSAPIVTATGGLGSISMTVADFNHDGRPDVAVANNITNDVSVMLGNGDGTFKRAVPYNAHLGPIAIGRADFNHDGNIDLAVVNSFSGDITILMGKGDGTFGMPKNISVGSSPTDVKIWDFNGDGIPDLAVTNGTQGERVVDILLGNGDGTFRNGGFVRVGNEPFALTLGDFNGDKIADLAVANLASNNVSMLLGNGNGTFQPATNYSAGHGPVDLTVGYFSGTTADLVICAGADAQIRVLPGNGDGTFQAPQMFSTITACNSVAPGDLDADGKEDIAVANTSGVVLLINNGQ